MDSRLREPNLGSKSTEALSTVDTVDCLSNPPRSPSNADTPAASLGGNRPSSNVSYPGAQHVILTKTDSISSGFPFLSALYDYGVTHEQWFQFTSEIVDVAKLTFRSDLLAWTTGVVVGTISTLVIVGPVAGYYAARPVHRKSVIKRVTSELRLGGRLRAILMHWNETVFQEKGFRAWLELPRLSGEDQPETDFDPDLSESALKKAKSDREKESRRFKILILPNSRTVTSPTMKMTEAFPLATSTHNSPAEVSGEGLTAELSQQHKMDDSKAGPEEIHNPVEGKDLQSPPYSDKAVSQLPSKPVELGDTAVAEPPQ
ncbi:hypothetical protein BP6252_03408 [Coleophoma cylindrospora]|uniref:Uncharacterized protein n=1 Tax=Coleophoma cylindrospora TaxID=1849047 RepID=A0A3D8S7N2_9HELO|nr:hypothetical protein BP6252_03408 [Coleophoma cylindrospora]